MSQERLLIESLLRIPDKMGNDVDFILNADQATFDANQTGRDIIAKYRQGGFSTYPLGRSFVRCLAYRNRRCVILAHNVDTSQKLLSRIHYMIKHIKCPEPDLKYSTQNRIVFNKTDSSIFIGTAGSDDYGVGDTITDLHCSEVSRWPNPQALLSGLFQAVPPGGNITIESTGRGVGNWFHQAVMRSTNGQGYKLHFFDWLNTPEYSLPVADPVTFMANLDETLEEPALAARGLTAGQLAWRRLKIAELNYDIRLFKENYPLTLVECFQSTGYGLFREVNYQPSRAWHSVDPWTRRLGDHPMPRRCYVAGVDVGAGVGQDYSVIEIFDAESGEQVFEYRNNMIEPDRFAIHAATFLKEFNNAYVNPERNNHGILFIRELIRLYPHGRIHQPQKGGNRVPSNEVATLASFGTYTSEVVKAMVLGSLQQQVREELVIHSEVLRDEMGSFVQQENGRMEAEVGCHDDCVMAAAMAAHVRARAVLLHASRLRREASELAPRTIQLFEAGRMFEELINKYGKEHPETGDVPISSGVMGEW